MRMLPVRYAPKSRPSTVMIGMSALRSACRTTTTRSPQSLRARRAHVVGAERVEHGRPRHAREEGDGAHPERERRQHQIAQTAEARGRQPVQRDGEQQDEQQADPVDGEADPEVGEREPEPVDRGHRDYAR